MWTPYFLWQTSGEVSKSHLFRRTTSILLGTMYISKSVLASLKKCVAEQTRTSTRAPRVWSKANEPLSKHVWPDISIIITLFSAMLIKCLSKPPVIPVSNVKESSTKRDTMDVFPTAVAPIKTILIGLSGAFSVIFQEIWSLWENFWKHGQVDKSVCVRTSGVSCRWYIHIKKQENDIFYWPTTATPSRPHSPRSNQSTTTYVWNNTVTLWTPFAYTDIMGVLVSIAHQLEFGKGFGAR